MGLKDRELERVFAERLKSARTLRGMTQRELGEVAQITYSAISDYERPTRYKLPSAGGMLRLADALGVRTDYLYGRGAADADPEAGGRLHQQLCELSARDRAVVAACIGQMRGWDRHGDSVVEVRARELAVERWAGTSRPLWSAEDVCKSYVAVVDHEKVEVTLGERDKPMEVEP